MSEAKRVVVYARVSTTEQAREGVSLDLQVARTTAYCEALGMKVVSVVRDAGCSGKNLRRPGMQEVERLIDRKQIDAVAIHKLDRLSRSVVDFGSLLERYKKRGITLVSVQDHLDTSSASGMLVVNLMMSVSQWERDIISERTREALQQVKAQGKHLGKPPVGWSVVGGELVANERYPLVERAHRLRRAGFTLGEIARAFVADGEVTATGGTRWHATTISRMLRAPLRSSVAS